MHPLTLTSECHSTSGIDIVDSVYLLRNFFWVWYSIINPQVRIDIVPEPQSLRIPLTSA